MSHNRALVDALEGTKGSSTIVLEKALGETQIVGQRLIDRPAWPWPPH